MNARQLALRRSVCWLWGHSPTCSRCKIVLEEVALDEKGWVGVLTEEWWRLVEQERAAS